MSAIFFLLAFVAAIGGAVWALTYMCAVEGGLVRFDSKSAASKFPLAWLVALWAGIIGVALRLAGL